MTYDLLSVMRNCKTMENVLRPFIALLLLAFSILLREAVIVSHTPPSARFTPSLFVESWGGSPTMYFWKPQAVIARPELRITIA